MTCGTLNAHGCIKRTLYHAYRRFADHIRDLRYDSCHGRDEGMNRIIVDHVRVGAHTDRHAPRRMSD